MRIPRVHVQNGLFCPALVQPSGDARNHLLKVLRLQEGDRVVCFNGDGYDYHGRLARDGSGHLQIAIESKTEPRTESPLDITLVQSVARGEKMDFILQKAAELGVKKIVPAVSERTEVKLDQERKERRLAHWQGVLVAACEQCGRAAVPELRPLSLLRDCAAALRESTAETQRIALHPSGSGKKFSGAIQAPRLPIVIAVGPEGGFGDQDLFALQEAGFILTDLGPRILRTETAGIAAIAALQALYGDL